MTDANEVPVTTQVAVETYQASQGMFASLLKEVRELSRKKPEATMSAGKVKLVNRVLKDLLTFLKDEPQGKYLEELDDQTLPQVSDALLVMVQFETALGKFSGRYHRHVPQLEKWVWMTKETVDELRKKKVRVF
jgi:hypothetical protein